jgi:Secretion system C-terminal sorting domain
LARIPDPKNYKPYLNICETKRCELDTTIVPLQISYLFNQIQWYRNDTLLIGYNNAIITPPLTGIFTVKANGLNGDRVVSPSRASVKVSVFPKAVIVQRDSNLVAPFYTNMLYQWYDTTGTLMTYGPTNIFTPKKSGWYRVDIYGEGACKSVSPYFYFNKSLVGLKDLGYNELDVTISPNPNSGNFTIELSQTILPNMKLRVTDLTGRNLMEKQMDIGIQTQTVDAAALPVGLYFLQVISEGKVVAVERFVKQ